VTDNCALILHELQSETSAARATVVASVLSVLRGVLSSSAGIEADWHPLGFMHLKLFSRGRESLRLHIWPSGDAPRERAAMSIHDHAWDLVSQVLCGELTNHFVDVMPDESGHVQMGIVRYRGAVNEVIPRGEAVRWFVSTSERYGPGDRYTVPRQVFHYTAPGIARPLATVVGAVMASKDPPRTLLPTPAGVRVMGRTPCTAEEVRREVSLVLDALS
jgi:hypothetical protein